MTSPAALIAFASVLALPLGAQESPIELKTPTGTVHGTLLMPAGTSGTVPVVLIIAGSGPTDRDGNSPLLAGKNNSLRYVAEALARNGVASVRYDKRGVAGSASAATSEADLRFTTYVDDAAAWVSQLAADPRFSRVMIIGHSEGSLISIMAARRTPVAKVMSLAGAGRSAAVVLDEQLSKNLPPTLLGDARQVLAELRAGRTVATPPPALAALFRPSVQPYLISWLNLDPAAEAAKVRVPHVVVQGTTDLQIGVADAERIGTATQDTRVEIVEGMNHVLKEVTDPAKQAASYSDSTLPLHPRLLILLRDFVTK